MLNKTLFLEIDKPNYVPIYTVQYDYNSRFYEITILNNSQPLDLTGIRVIVAGKKPDGKEVFNSCKVLDAKKGLIQLELTEQMNAVNGASEYALELFSADGMLSSQPFKLIVTRSTISKSVESSKELGALKDALNEVQDIDNRFAQTNAQLSAKTDKTVTENLQGQINNLVINGTGDSNPEVVQARGSEQVLNDRLNKIENGERLKNTNIDVLKTFDVTSLDDVSFGKDKPKTLTLQGFNGSNLVQINTSELKGSHDEFTVLVKFSLSNSDTRGNRIAFKAYDNTWGSGKATIDLGQITNHEPRYVSYTFKKSEYSGFALFRLCQIGNDYGTQLDVHYVKIFNGGNIDVDGFDKLFKTYGDVKTYSDVSMKALPSNMMDLLSKEQIPDNVKRYVDDVTEGIDALKIFDTSVLKNHIHNREIPNQVITNEGNGTGIIRIELDELDGTDDEVVFLVRYSVDKTSTYTRHVFKIFDNTWTNDKFIDLGGNSIKDKKYFIAYRFKKSVFQKFVLFRFAKVGSGKGEVVINIDYAKLFNSNEISSAEWFDNLYNDLGNLEKYPIVNFKTIPSDLEEKLNSDNKNVVMIGDSIANQFASSICADNGDSEYNFQNKCVGGESTLDTMARLGAIPYMVLPPFTIPSDTTNSGEVNLVSSLFLDVEFDDSTAKPTWKNGYVSDYSATPQGINPYSELKCEIAGVRGTLYFKRNTGTTTYFKRNEPGNAVVIDRPTEVYPIGTSAYDKDAVYTCFMGTNEGWCNRGFEKDRTHRTAGKTDAELLVSYYKKIAQYINTNKFLFMGFYMCAFLDQTTADKRIEWWEYFEELMSKEFGNKYFSVRKYLREIGYKDANVQLTAQDLQDIKDGKIPIIASTGASDGVHVTGRISACVANEILKRLKGLGYINSYNEIDVMKYNNGQTSTNPDDFLPPQS